MRHKELHKNRTSQERYSVRIDWHPLKEMRGVLLGYVSKPDSKTVYSNFTIKYEDTYNGA